MKTLKTRAYVLFVITILGMAFTAHAETTPPSQVLGSASEGSSPASLSVTPLASSTGKRKSITQATARIVFSQAPDLNSTDRPAYRTNAMLGIETGTAVGVGATAFTPLPDSYIAEPLSVIAFGNARPRFEATVLINAGGPQISLARLSYRTSSSDTSAGYPRGTVAFEGSLDGTYSTTRVGISFGPDRMKGTSDDPSRLTGGPASASVDQILYLGFGFTFPAINAENAEATRRYIVEKNLTIAFEYLLDGNVIASKTLRFSPSPVTPPPPANPAIVSFTATPAGIIAGQSVVLNVTTTNALTASISPSVGTVTVNGPVVAQPNASTTYTLTITGAGGSTATATTLVAVTPAIPPPVIPDPAILSFTASKTNITVGELVTIGWSTTNTVLRTITPEIGEVVESGSLVVSPRATTTYVYTATGTNNVAVQSSLTITVRTNVPTLTAGITPQTVTAGQPATIDWTATRATTVTIEGVGEVPVLSGSRVVWPTETGRYSLVATGPDGTATFHVDIVVLPPPPKAPTITATANPPSIYPGGSSTITWTSTDADSVTLYPGVGTVERFGSYTVFPTVNTTYEVTGTGPGGTISVPVQVTVLPPPKPPTFKLLPISKVSPDGRIAGGTELELSGSVRNLGPDTYAGSITNVWQYRLDGTSDWVTWEPAGVMNGLEAGAERRVSPHPWTAEEKETLQGFSFRLTSITEFGETSSNQGITIPAQKAPAVAPSDNEGVTLYIIALGDAPQGTFTLQRATTVGGAWVDVGEVVNLTGKFPVFLVPQGTDGTVGLFRAVKK